MKLIDLTPLQDEKGEFNLMARIQGMLKYGFGWFAEVQAQKLLIPQLERVLEKGFVLIRNFNLPGSDIVIPLILIGLGGIYVIYVVSAKGHFEAKGDQWNKVDSGSPQPVSVNPLDMAKKLTKALQKYLEIHKIKVPASIEPIVIAVNPGAHIDSMRPIVKVVKSDAIKAFAASLMQATPIMRPEQVNTLAERIINPPPPQEEKPEPVAEEPPPAFYSESSFEDAAPSGALDAGNFDFSFQEEGETHAAASASEAALPAAAPRRPKPKSNKPFGMTKTQLMILGGMFVFWLCLMAGFGALLFLNL